MEIKQAMKELKTAQYLGEEGDMAVNCKTKLGAFRKFKQQVREDCGESSELEDMTMDNIGIGWVFVVTAEMKKEDYEDRFEEDTEYYVSYKEKSPYQVWIYTS